MWQDGGEGRGRRVRLVGKEGAEGEGRGRRVRWGRKGQEGKAGGEGRGRRVRLVGKEGAGG